jgi:hypothetical protein
MHSYPALTQATSTRLTLAVLCLSLCYFRLISANAEEMGPSDPSATTPATSTPATRTEVFTIRPASNDSNTVRVSTDPGASDELIGPTRTSTDIVSSAPPTLPKELGDTNSSEMASPPGISTPPIAANAGAQDTTSNALKRIADRQSRLADRQIDLINILADKGFLTKDQSDKMIGLAKQDQEEIKGDVAVLQQASVTNSQTAANGNGSLEVNYVPDVVKEQIKEQLKQDVLTQAREENWANPRKLPSWASRLHFTGDVRTRYEGDLFPSGNNNQGVNYNAINTSAKGLNINAEDSTWASPNVDQDRDRFRLRARFGVEADLDEHFTSGLRIATGDSNSPVSENQSIGYAGSSQGGNFSKYSLWLDRAFIKYDIGRLPERDVPGHDFNISVGRFDNPFFSSSMIWADDLAFDGVALRGSYQAADGITPFMTVGAFPVFNTDFNFSTDRASKYDSYDKWLYAAQVGSDFKVNQDVNVKVAVAYYHFQNIEGRVSSPYTPISDSDNADTDSSRPAFSQKGNTYIALRNYDSAYLTTLTSGSPLYQYFGLATPFHEIALTARVDYSHFDPFHMWLVTEVVKNVAFDKNDILNNGATTSGSLLSFKGPVNNYDDSGNYQGGDMGGNLTFNVGHPSLEKLWDWNASVGYRYVESDSVVDGFCESDFGGGGTNLQGYTLACNLALSKYVWGGLKWMSATNVSGVTFREDVIQVDLNAKF